MALRRAASQRPATSPVNVVSTWASSGSCAGESGASAGDSAGSVGAAAAGCGLPTTRRAAGRCPREAHRASPGSRDEARAGTALLVTRRVRHRCPGCALWGARCGATLPGAGAARRTPALLAVSRQVSSSHPCRAGRTYVAPYPKPLGRTKLWGEAPVPGIDAVSRSRGGPPCSSCFSCSSPFCSASASSIPSGGWPRRCWPTVPPGTAAVMVEAGAVAAVPILGTTEAPGTTRTTGSAGIVRTAGTAVTPARIGRADSARTVGNMNTTGDPCGGQTATIRGRSLQT